MAVVALDARRAPSPRISLQNAVLRRRQVLHRSKVVATASYVFLEHCLGIFDSYHIKIKPVA